MRVKSEALQTIDPENRGASNTQAIGELPAPEDHGCALGAVHKTLHLTS